MSFSFIHDFKLQIHQLLINDVEIKASVNNIYLSVVQDAKYPFIFINILKVEDQSKFSCNIYNIEFEICVFARDKNQGTLLALLDKITSILTTQRCQFGNYQISGMKTGELVFEQGHDLITTKLAIKFKALLKRME